jgi:orotidine-5'-phosphate decarboxylase
MKAGTLAHVHRVRWHWDPPNNFCPNDGTPYIVDWRSWDIPNTVCTMILRLPGNPIGVTLSPRGGPEYVKLVERAARKRGIRVLWFTMKG